MSIFSKASSEYDEEAESTSSFDPNDSDIEASVKRKLDVRLLSTLCWLSVVLSLGTVAIGNARVMGMEEELHMHGNEFNVTVEVFSIPVIVCALPAYLAVQFFRPARFIGILTFLGGVVTIGQGVTQSYPGLIVCRLLFGVFEVSVQSGSIFLLAAFYPQHALHKRMSSLVAFRLVANAFGGLLAYGLAHMHEGAGLSSWRWLFCIEGILTCLSGLLALLILPTWPKDVEFLSHKEKEVLLSSLKIDSADDAENNFGWSLLKELLREPKLYFGTAIQFCVTAISISSVTFLPTILAGFNWDTLRTLSMTVPVYLTALILVIVNGAASDYVGLRYPFFAAPMCFVVTGYAVLLSGGDVTTAVRYMACFLVISGAFAVHANSSTWLSNNFVGTKRRGLVLGLVSTFGNSGQLVGTNVFLDREAPWYKTGFAVSLALSIAALAVGSVQLVYFIRGNHRRAAGTKGLTSAKSLPDGRVRYRNVY